MLLSDDEETKNNGGLLVNPNTGTTMFESDQIDRTIFFAIDKMSVGEVSRPILMSTFDGKQAYRLVYLKSKTTPHIANLKDDYQKIKDVVTNLKKDIIINEWIKNKKKSTFIEIKDNYLNCIFKNNWYPEKIN